jgi:hypothetical protein
LVCGRDSERWRELMDATRAVAVELVEEGVVEITQRGKKVDVTSFRGPIRVRLSRPPVEPEARGEVFGKKETKDETVKVERGPVAEPGGIAVSVDRLKTEPNVAAESERAALRDEAPKKRRKTKRDA